MTPFTNDDLKRLQEKLSDPQQGTSIRNNEINAILARLEAAEKVCYSVLAVEDMIKIPLVLGDDSRERAMKSLNEKYRTWRMAAGLDHA